MFSSKTTGPEIPSIEKSRYLLSLQLIGTVLIHICYQQAKQQEVLSASSAQIACGQNGFLFCIVVSTNSHC